MTLNIPQKLAISLGNAAIRPPNSLDNYTSQLLSNICLLCLIMNIRSIEVNRVTKPESYATPVCFSEDNKLKNYFMIFSQIILLLF